MCRAGGGGGGAGSGGGGRGVWLEPLPGGTRLLALTPGGVGGAVGITPGWAVPSCSPVAPAAALPHVLGAASPAGGGRWESPTLLSVVGTAPGHSAWAHEARDRALTPGEVGSASARVSFCPQQCSRQKKWQGAVPLHLAAEIPVNRVF